MNRAEANRLSGILSDIGKGWLIGALALPVIFPSDLFSLVKCASCGIIIVYFSFYLERNYEF